MGIYTTNFTVDFIDILKEKYMEDSFGSTIGIFEGETAAYMCGIKKEKPANIRVISNLHKANIRGEYRCLGNEAAIIGSPVTITNRNHEVLTCLQLAKYLFAHPESRYDIEEYWKRHHMKPNVLKEYAYVFGIVFANKFSSCICDGTD